MLYTWPHCLLKLKKGNQKQEVGKKYEENFELLNGHRNVNVNAHIADRMWIITKQCIFILIVQYIFTSFSLGRNRKLIQNDSD